MVKVDTIGFLTADPTAKKAGNNDIAEFRIGARTNRKNSAGEYISNFFTVSAFGTTGAYVMKNAKKGSKVYVSGTLADMDFTKKDGTVGHSLSISANTVEMMSNSGNNVSSAPAAKRQQATDMPDYDAVDPDGIF